MHARRTGMRSIALIFLLMAAVEVFGCELLASPGCELSSPLSGNSSSDECFCCCHHIVPGTVPVTLAPLETIDLVVPVVIDSTHDLYSPAIDQPPKA